ncbi:MAG: hypothetical protein JRE38_07230 [Deltaproteobacteria bacterium]|nr:hypothetical protein [Deltaproteobacteria bacterium]MBW2577845.1 hypothetical protein [Deltaproteobacteria bacterium]MBW2693070.1 hypothetical protein [Deltaproteobacteria bacterium]
MEENAYIASIAAGIFFLVAGVRLLRLHRRTGERPELLLGLYFAFSGLYYLGYNIPNLFQIDTWPYQLDLLVEWTFVLGVFPYLFFIRSVFRPDDAWGGWIVGACSVFLLAGTVLTTDGGSVDYSFGNPWFIVQWLGYTAPSFWLGWEALLYRQNATKRARIGLCPPIVANRYLLIALFGGFQVLACLGDLSFANDINGDQAISLFTDAILGGTEIASVAVLWLAFFPPLFYTNWITRRAVILPTPMDG